jgi:hypothetical protein
LKPLAIAPDSTGTNRVKGYKRPQFEEPFERYLFPTPAEGAFQPLNRSKCDEMGISEIFKPLNHQDGRAVGECKKFNNDGLVSGCAVADGEHGEEVSRWPGLSPRAVEQIAREVAALKMSGVAQIEGAIRKRLARSGVPPEAHEIEVEKVVRQIDEARNP